MRSEIIRLYKVVHTWVGIVAGLGLFIAFYAGGFAVFREPLTRWATPPSGFAQPVPLEAMQELVVSTLAANPRIGKDFVLSLTELTEHGPSPLGWREREGDEDHDTLRQRHYYATLKADGTPAVVEGRPTMVAEFIDVLHRVIGLPFDTDLARLLTGIISLLYALALISGLVIVLPSLVKDLFALRLGKNLKRMWMDVHNVVGVASLPFHLVIAVTAAVFGLHDGIYYVQDKLIHDGKLRATPSSGAPTAKRDPASMLPPVVLLERARELSPTFEPHALQYTRLDGARPMVRVWGHDPTAFSARALGGFVALEPWTGKVLTDACLPGKGDAAMTLIGSLFSLHFATFGGLPVKWIYFLLALAGAWLFFTGNLLWVESRRRKASREGDPTPAQRTDVRLMAAATVGVCLGCVSGISFTIVLAKWLHGHVENLRAWHQYGYYAVFLGSIGWALLRGGARASVDLLRLAAAVTLAIPLTSLVGWLAPGLGPWAGEGTFGVDLTALAGGLSFLWMARATARRVHHGAPDSVWSARASTTRDATPVGAAVGTPQAPAV